jgi:ABC-type uncharacterized transport system ATPase subunit
MCNCLALHSVPATAVRGITGASGNGQAKLVEGGVTATVSGISERIVRQRNRGAVVLLFSEDAGKITDSPIAWQWRATGKSLK